MVILLTGEPRSADGADADFDIFRSEVIARHASHDSNRLPERLPLTCQAIRMQGPDTAMSAVTCNAPVILA
jgi:hypothetical protein